MKKMIKLISLIAIVLLSLNCNKVLAAQKLVCIYSSYSYTYKQPNPRGPEYTFHENSPAIMIEQNSTGDITLYTNSLSSEIDENWQVQEIDKYNALNFETDSLNKSDNTLTSCPSYMTYGKNVYMTNNGQSGYAVINITLNDTAGSSKKEYKSKSYQELLEEKNNQSPGNGSTSNTLTCVYNGSGLEAPVAITQDGNGSITIRRKGSSISSGNDDWRVSSYKLDFDGTRKKEETANGYILTGCPNYVSFAFGASGTIYLNDNPSAGNDNKLYNPYIGKNWTQTEELLKAGLNEDKYNFHYSELCTSNEGVLKAIKIIGRIIQICKWVVPFLVILFGMIDFIKAVVSNDDKAMNKATKSLIVRIIIGLVVLVLPRFLLVVMEMLDTLRVKDITEGPFAACTRCILDVGSCDDSVAASNNNTTSNSGAGGAGGGTIDQTYFTDH